MSGKTIPSALLDEANKLPPLASLIARAAENPKSIAFAEGSDPRIVEAAGAALNAGVINQAHLIGPRAKIESMLRRNDLLNATGIEIHDPEDSPLFDTLAARFVELRSHKKLSIGVAKRATSDPLVFAALLVETGRAQGTIGGAVATTTNTVRAALQVIGRAKGAPLVSSFFYMILPEDHPLERPVMVFSDCGMQIDPDAEQLASIASQAADSFETLAGSTPKVGMLSFSTHRSARHPHVRKMRDATKMLITARPQLIVDGELQLDAAIVPEVAAAKAPQGVLRGEANVLIFPNLDAGNIGYKMAQRFGGATAIGPVLQGLAKPANDLSRGCSASDVFAMIAVTVLQAGKL